MPVDSFDMVQIGVGNQSWNKTGVNIECHKRFNMKYDHHSDADKNTYSKMLPFSLLFLYNTYR